MSTYQDRARDWLEATINGFAWLPDGSNEAEINRFFDQALSELASIVEEEIIQADETEPDIPRNDYYWRIRNELRAKQRDQLSNRSKSDE